MFSAVTQALMNAPLLTENQSSNEAFDIITFLTNLFGYIKAIGHWIMIVAGAILIIIAVIQIVKGLAGGGRGQVNWVMSIGCLLVGGLLIFGGWNLAANVASMGKGTIEQINNGTYNDGNTDSVKNGGGFSSSPSN